MPDKPPLLIRRCSGWGRSAHTQTYVQVQIDIFPSVWGLGEDHVVDCINDVGSRKLFAAEPATVEALDCVFATLYTVKLDVDFAVVVVQSKTKVNDLAILVFALVAHLGLEFLLPTFLGLSVKIVSIAKDALEACEGNIRGLIVDVLDKDAAGGGRLHHSGLFLLGLGSNLLLRLVSARKLAHKRLSAVI